MRFIKIVGLLLFSVPAGAQVINAASCSSTDVQAACTALSSSTTTLNIPSCPAGVTWTTKVTCTVPSGNTNLSILGTGSLTTTGGGDQTVIIDGDASDTTVFSIATNSTATGVVRLAGITFKMSSAAAIASNGMVAVSSGSEQFHFDHSHLDTSQKSQSTGMRINGCTYGVADHNIVDAAIGQVNNGIQEYNQQSCFSDAVGVGDQAWAHASTFGTASNFFLEDNVFNNSFANDCTTGGNFVMRHNTFNATGNNSTLQTHPTGGAARWRGCRNWEIYLNTWVFSQTTPTFMNACIFASSGTGYTWGNTIPSSSANGGTGCKQLIAVESSLPNGSNGSYTELATPNGWGYCGTNFFSAGSGGGSAWNGSTTGTGYPCLDQPGRGKSDLLVGGFSSDGSGSNNVCDQTVHGTGANCGGFGFNGNWPNQALEPLYEWLDAYSAIPSNTTSVYTPNTATGTTFTDNHDIYHWCNASVDPGLANGCTSAFNGTVGVGSGPLSGRPLTCTSGVAYWAIDQGNWNQSGSGGQGVLFICASNAWPSSPSYTPYTYPHPLVTGGGGTSTPPSSLILLGSNTGIVSNWSISGSSCATGVNVDCISSYTETLTPPQSQPIVLQTISGSALTYTYSPGGNLPCGTWNVSLVANWLDFSGSPTASPPVSGSVNEPCPTFVAKPPTGFTLAVI